MKIDNITIKNEIFDGRVKLTASQKEEIRTLYKQGTFSKRGIARDFGVSRRLIDFILSPEKADMNVALRMERGGSSQYYRKESHRDYMRKHRAKKKELHRDGLI